MSAAEFIVLALIVGGACAYLARSAWQRFAGRGSGCCGSCLVGRPKIRLDGGAKQESIGG